jgi:hypothetical protein
MALDTIQKKEQLSASTYQQNTSIMTVKCWLASKRAARR